MNNAMGWIILVAGMVAVIVAIKGTQHSLIPGLFGTGAPPVPGKASGSLGTCNRGDVYWELSGTCKPGYIPIQEPTANIGQFCVCT